MVWQRIAVPATDTTIGVVMPYKDTEARREYQRQYNIKHRERRYWNKKRSDAKLMDQRMAKNKERYHSDPEEQIKRKARVRVNSRIHKGAWPRASFFVCSDCNAHAREYHHEDYSQWWAVEPLCRACHVKRHQAMPSKL